MKTTAPLGLPTTLRTPLWIACLLIVSSASNFPSAAFAATSKATFTVSASAPIVELIGTEPSTVSLRVTRSAGFTRRIRFSLSGQAKGVASRIDNTPEGAVLTFAASSIAPRKNKVVTVIASGGGVKRRIPLMVSFRPPSSTVSLAPPPPPSVEASPTTSPTPIPNGTTPPGTTPAQTGSFSLSVAPANQVTVQPGKGKTVLVIVSATGGYTGAPSFFVDGLPPGVLPSFDNPSSRTGTKLTFTAADTAARGAYPIVVRAVDGSLSATVSFTLKVKVLGQYEADVIGPRCSVPVCAYAPGATYQLEFFAIPRGLTPSEVPDLALTIDQVPAEKATFRIEPGPREHTQNVILTIPPSTTSYTFSARFTMTPIDPADGAPVMFTKQFDVVPTQRTNLETQALTITYLTTATGYTGSVDLSEISNGVVGAKLTFENPTGPAGLRLAARPHKDDTGYTLVAEVNNLPAGTYPLTIDAVIGTDRKKLTFTLTVLALKPIVIKP